jgi:type IV pilus assembly protein PilA
MPYNRLINSSRAFTLIELMIVIGIIALLAAIAIPNFISYRNKAICSKTETEASHIVAAIADYFGNPGRTEIPAIDDLKISLLNPAVIMGTDPNVHITVQVTDRTSRCPLQYQNAHPGWDSNYVFTKVID